MLALHQSEVSILLSTNHSSPGLLDHLVGARLGRAQRVLVLEDEGLQLGQLQLRVEVPGHGGDHPAHAGADGGVPVGGDLVPGVTDPVPGEVAADNVPVIYEVLIMFLWDT